MHATMTISCGVDQLDMTLVHRYLNAEAYWAQGRSLDAVKASFEHSLCFGVHHKENCELVGFCRVVTDYVALAYLMDFFIVEASRKSGVGKMLLSHVLNYPSIRNVDRWLLATRDAHDFYRKHGFKHLTNHEYYLVKSAKMCIDGDT